MLIEVHLLCSVDVRNGLFDQVDVVVTQYLVGVDGLRFVSVLVDVDLVVL